MPITPQEYDYLEKRWAKLHKEKRELERKLAAIHKELAAVEKKMNEPIQE